MSRGTPHHAVRVPDDLWRAAIVKARIQGMTLAELIVAFLRDFVAEEKP